MEKIRLAFYTALVLMAALTIGSGCGKPKEPPPGANTGDTAPPAIDLGTDKGAPQESPASPTETPSGAGKSEGDKGEQKGEP